MKKTVILAAMLAVPAFAGQKVTVQPATAAPTPAPAQWAVELGYNYNWGAKDIMSWEVPCKEIRTHGADITLVRPIDENQAFTLRLGYNYGSRSWGGCYYEESDPVDGYYASASGSDTIRTHTFSLMPGYRYTHALCDKTSLYCGVNVGVSNQSLKYRGADSFDFTYPDYSEHEDGTMKQHGSQWGLAYSAEAGVRYAITEAVDFFVAYQFTGNTCKPKLDGGEGYHVRGKAQNYHGVRAGFGIKF
ncbi:MAG: outer membrane beta-barrel protein [Akkermansia sp.]|nr:outer membrane beta-barrel protein [Akkermansia sp.]